MSTFVVDAWIELYQHLTSNDSIQEVSRRTRILLLLLHWYIGSGIIDRLTFTSFGWWPTFYVIKLKEFLANWKLQIESCKDISLAFTSKPKKYYVFLLIKVIREKIFINKLNDRNPSLSEIYNVKAKCIAKSIFQLRVTSFIWILTIHLSHAESCIRNSEREVVFC